VLAGLVLLGTILSSALVARGRFLRQWRAADEKLTAVRAAEQLLAKWVILPAGAAPVPREGTLPDSPDLRWRTSWVSSAGAARLGARVARLEILDRLGSARPLVSIEFLVRTTKPATAPTTQRSSP
jgi:hypothetical protein